MREFVLSLYRKLAAHRTIFFVAAGYFLLVVLLSVTAILLVATTRRSVGLLNEFVYTAVDETQLLFNLQADAHALQSASLHIIFNTETEDVALERMRMDSIEAVSKRRWNQIERLPDSLDRLMFSHLRSTWCSNAGLRHNVLEASDTGSIDNERAINLYYTVLKPAFENYLRQLESAEKRLEQKIAVDLQSTNNKVNRSSHIVHILLAANFIVIIAGGILLNRHLRKSVTLREKLLAIRIDRQREISRMSIEIQENQKAEIGRELHDNVNQLLTAAKLQLSMTHDRACPREYIERSMCTIETAIQEIRALSKSLVSPMQDALSFHESLVTLVQTYEALLPGCSIRLHADATLPLAAGNPLSLMIYRIVQEQLTNIAKHANPSLVTVRLAIAKDLLMLCIKDNGKGFDTCVASKGIGLKNIINRAEAFDGQVNIISAPGLGCTVKVYFPLAAVPD